MKKLLNNPIVVVILALTAMVYLYWNVISPMMGSTPSPKKSSVNQQTRTSVDKNETSSNSRNSNQRKQTDLDSLANDPNLSNKLPNLWVFQYSRDPFKDEKRDPKGILIDLRPKRPSKQLSKERRRNLKRYSKPKSKLQQVQAISIGPKNSVALIDGQLIEVSKVDNNFQDTLKLEIHNQIKTFTFKPKTNP